MPFTSEVKDELARLRPPRRCCRIAELSALLRLEGSLHITGPHRVTLHTESENAAVARKMFSLLKELYALAPELRVEKAPRLKGHNCYCLFLGEEPQVAQALNELCLLDDNLRPVMGVPSRLTRRSCCAAAYLRGAFLGGGYVSRPESPAHLEINVRSEETAEGLARLAERCGLDMHVTRRRDIYSVYTKSRSEQSDLLAFLGAHRAVLRLQSDAVLREMRAEVNRRVNSETANLARAVDAAQRQLRDIRRIDEALGLERLSPALREVALKRLEHPEASMQELGACMRPPLTKSAVHHRLLRIRRIASSL